MDLLLLDELSPRTCKKCGKFLKNSFVNSIVSAVIPVILAAASIYLFAIDLLISLSLLLLIPILRITLAEPLKYSLGPIAPEKAAGETPGKNEPTKLSGAENLLK